MNTNTPFKLTREKHLDHMVRVVPFIVMGYAIQCYVLMQMSEALGVTSIFFLGACLISMIGAFITYDVKHQVTFLEDRFEVQFLFLKKTIYYSEITAVHISESKQTFASLKVVSNKHTTAFYFVDDADRIKAYLEKDQITIQSKAA